MAMAFRHFPKNTEIDLMKSIFPRYHIGHFLNQPNNPVEFAVARFEEMEDPDVEDVHQHTFYEILWVEEGQSTQVIDYQSYAIFPGSLFFISPFQVHHFEDWQHLHGGSIFFQASFLQSQPHFSSPLLDCVFLDNGYANPHFCPPKEDWKNILQTIHSLENEQKQAQPDPQILQGYLQVLLAQVRRSWRDSLAPNPSLRSLHLFKQFKQKLEENAGKGKTAQFYASQLNITPHHLNVVCQEVAGRSTSQVIRDRTILEAKRLLTFTDLNATEIAQHLHLTDSSWFAKIFRQSTQSSPLDFRRKMAPKYRI